MKVGVLSTAALLCAGAFSTPIESGERGANVYFTTEPFWNTRSSGSDRLDPILGYDVCIDLKGTPFDKTISSFGPAKSAVCILFDDYNCSGNSEFIFYSGYAEMGFNGWDNRVASYRCGYCIVGVDEGCRDQIG